MNGRKLRKPELLLFVLPLLLPILYFGASAVRKHFQYEVKADVGQFPTEQAEQQAAVKRLSSLLKEYPNATEFRIYGNYPEIRTGGTVVYKRQWQNKPRHWHGMSYGENALHLNQLLPNQLPLPRNPSTSFMRQWPFSAVGNITDQDVHAIAKSSGVVQDVFHRASERYKRIDEGRKNEEKKLGIDIDYMDRHYPKGTLH